MSLFVARQPILNRLRQTIAYELLFRSGPENAFGDHDRDVASVRVVHDSLMEFGLSSLLGNNGGFFNLSRVALLEGLYGVLPPGQVVLELLEDVAPDTAVVAACSELKRAGYRLALDDFELRPGYEPLLALADFVKVDFLATDAQVRRELAERMTPYEVTLVAEKLETEPEFEEACELGYTLFQGFFFCRPQMIERAALPRFKLNYLNFLSEVHRPRLDFDALERSIKQEASLSVKLLRLLNSAAFNLSREITSIRRALAMLGERRIRTWASVVALSGLGEDRPSELVVTGLIRARFSELLGASTDMDGRELELFLIGMLSVIDALLARPLSAILDDLALPADVTRALMGGDNELRDIFEIVLSYERGEWVLLERQLRAQGLDSSRIAPAYRESVEWANDVFGKVR